jgi:hypothetical protein
MTDRIKTDAVLCTLPYDWIADLRLTLAQAGVETMGSQDRDETMLLLQNHTFKGVITVSSWFTQPAGFKSDVMFTVLVHVIPLLILDDMPDQFHWFSNMLIGPHEYCALPCDLKTILLRAKSLGMVAS